MNHYKKAEKLKSQAEQYCAFWKHDMTSWKTLRRENDHVILWAECTVCGADVAVNTKPNSNEVELGGSAVALNCPI